MLPNRDYTSKSLCRQSSFQKEQSPSQEGDHDEEDNDGDDKIDDHYDDSDR
jgi:hypothetical protein